MGNIGQVNYSPSQAGLIGLTKTTARELTKRGNVVNMPCVLEIFAQKEQGMIEVSIGGQGKRMVEGTFYLE